MSAWKNALWQYQPTAEPVFVPSAPTIQPQIADVVRGVAVVALLSSPFVGPVAPPTVAVAGAAGPAVVQTVAVTQYQAVGAPVRITASTPFAPVQAPDQVPSARQQTPRAFVEPFAPAFPVPLLSWAAIYADVARGHRPLTDWLTFALEPLPITITVDQLGWRGDYPDWLQSQRPADYPAWVTGETSSAFPVPPLSWKPKFDDVARGHRPLVDWQTLAFNPNPITLTTDKFGWRGSYPDWLQLLRPADYPAHATGATSSVFTVPALSWKASYADTAPGPRPLADLETLAFNPLPITLTTDRMGWRGRYPDWLQVLRPADYPAWTTGSTASSLPVPALSWKATYADRVPGYQPLVDWLTLATQPSPIAITTDQMAWRGRYPDWLPLQRPADFMAHATGATSSVLPVPLLSWKPVYADAILFARVPTEALQWHAMWPTPILVPTDQIDWRSQYPDWLPYLRPVEFAPWATGVTASTLPLPAPTVWLPRYPDRIDVARTVREPQAFALDAFARPSLVPLTWLPTFPDAARRVVLVPESWFGQTFPLVPALAWKAIYPDRAPGRQPLADWQTFAWSEWELFRPPSPILAWHPTYADFARGLPPLPVGALPFSVGVKPLFFGGPEFARLVGERVFHAVVISETTFEPAMSSENASQARVKNEGTNNG